MRMCFRNSLRRTLKDFRNDQSGMALIYVTAALPVIIGLSLLAIDVGRLSSLQSSLQHGADALALAGAGELDRRPDAIERANDAIADLITTNTSLFATSVVTIDENRIGTPCFLSSLPASDATPIDPLDCLPASDATEKEASSPSARFVQVIVTPQNFNTIFPVTFLGGASNSAQSSAEAVAGFDAAVCAFTPMFMCNPYESATNTDVMRTTEIYEHIATRLDRRRLIEFKKHSGGSAQWSPGNFGFLQSPLGPGANALGEAIASETPSACFIQNGVYTKPGNTTVSKDAFNVRFDLYKGSYKKDDYSAAMNVRKSFWVPPKGNGKPGNVCDAEESLTRAEGYGLPRDSCFATQSCTINTGRIGNGNWDQDNNGTADFQAYWDFNHPGVTRPSDESGTQFSNSNLPTRFEIYRWEIDNNQIGTASTAIPACYQGTGATADDTPDRRIVYGAILNCVAAELDSGAGGPYQAAAFGKFFMTEPMPGSQDSLWLELVDVVEPGEANSVARDIVQLYR